MTPVDSCSVPQRPLASLLPFKDCRAINLTPPCPQVTRLLETEDNISPVLVSDEGVPGLWGETANSYRPGRTCRTRDVNTVNLVAVWKFLVKRIILK